MARKRMIDPSFWDSPTMGRLSRGARLLYLGMISQADDSGRLIADGSLLKARIFPYDKDVVSGRKSRRRISVEDLRNELVAAKQIVVYSQDGTTYAAFPNWSKWQKISHPTDSRIPPIPESLRNHSGNAPESLRNDSVLIESNRIEKNRKEGKGKSQRQRSDCIIDEEGNVVKTDWRQKLRDAGHQL